MFAWGAIVNGTFVPAQVNNQSYVLGDGGGGAKKGYKGEEKKIFLFSSFSL